MSGGARALLDEARERAAKVLGCKPSEVIFTSGGTESSNLAIFGIARFLTARAATSLPLPLSIMLCFMPVSIWRRKDSKSHISP
jgi:hypothetical protein